jgi:hypothetical protein
MLFDYELNVDIVYLFIQELHFNSCISNTPYFVVCCAMLPYKHHSYLIFLVRSLCGELRPNTHDSYIAVFLQELRYECGVHELRIAVEVGGEPWSGQQSQPTPLALTYSGKASTFMYSTVLGSAPKLQPLHPFSLKFVGLTLIIHSFDSISWSKKYAHLPRA